MFSGLKDKAVKKALEVLEEKMGKDLQEKVAIFKNLQPADIQDDGMYQKAVVDPLWMYVNVQSAGAITAAQKVVKLDMKSQFGQGLFQVRNELINVEDGKVRLDPDFAQKLAPTLIEAFKQ